METQKPITIVATLDLTDANQRRVVEMIRRFHSGRWPVFEALHDMRRDGAELVTVSKWRGARQPFAVVRWSLTDVAIGWRSHKQLRSATADFLNQREQPLRV